ncbi:MAG TPA: hypothetical protein VNA26_04320, partial [Chitinophagaceae bacterium]|nr:hypothetical protein [Chitinophagaceae bacterium]
MNPHLQNILSLLQENENITEDQKIAISKSLKAADKEFEITAFKLDRTEKVKRTTAILLEETIEELEQKRKAVEAQNRELEIEASLERVRTVAMGMQKQEDLLNICEVMYKELQNLDFSELRNALIHTFDDDQNYFIDYDYSDFTGGCISRIPYSGHPAIDKFIREIRSANDAFTEIVITGKELEDWKEFRRNNSEADDARLDTVSALYYYFYSIGPGDIGISTFHSISDDKRELLKRFRNVFDLAYRRYTDIEKAEAQAREAQIEAALERVRSRTIGMHKSEELREVIQVVFEQLRHLDFKIDSAHFNLNYKDSDDYNLWSAAPGQPYPVKTYIPYFNHPVFITARQAKEKGLDFFTESYTQEEKNQFFEHLFKYAPGISEERRRYILSGKGVAASTVLLNTISLWIMNYAGVPYSAAENAILKRFGKIFEQSHTRFLDLQKAEAQAREAQIEAALERVRSRSMAMHKSDELADAAQLLYREFGSLGISTFTCGYMFIDETKQTQTGWFVLPDGSFLPNFIVFPLTGDHVLDTRYKDWKEKKLLHICEIQGEVNKEHHRFLSNYVPSFVKEDIFSKIPDRIIFNCANFSEGYLLILSTEHFSLAEQQTVIRFAKVFEQTYTRFLDLQKAEAQARESQIEAALERVRAQTMAMNKSEDLQQVVSVIFRELDKLELKTLRCGIGIINADNRTVDVWTTTTTTDGFDVNFSGNESMDIHPMLQRVFAAWEKQEDFSYTLQGEDLVSYYNTMKGNSYTLPEGAVGAMVSDKDVHYYYCSIFSSGGIYFFREIPFTEEIIKIIRRFANAFSLAYKRFEDLKQAEARALEAIKESSLDRVRAEIASMRTTDDLQRITPIIWRELMMLEVPFFRCGVFIIDEINTEVKIYLSAPDGHSLGV